MLRSGGQRTGGRMKPCKFYKMEIKDQNRLVNMGGTVKTITRRDVEYSYCTRTGVDRQILICPINCKRRK